MHANMIFISLSVPASVCVSVNLFLGVHAGMMRVPVYVGLCVCLMCLFLLGFVRLSVVCFSIHFISHRLPGEKV